MTSHKNRTIRREEAEGAYRFILASGGIPQDANTDLIAGAAAVVKACEETGSPVLLGAGYAPLSWAHHDTMRMVYLYRRYQQDRGDGMDPEGTQGTPGGGSDVGAR